MSNCALLLIDFQNVFNDPKLSWYCPKFNDALKVALLCHQKLQCQTYITGFLPPNTKIPIWNDYFNCFPDISTDSNNVIYDLNFPADSYGKIVWSPTFGKWDTIRKHIFNEPGDSIDTVYICGVATDCCVLATALAAVDDGMNVYIISDGCASGNDTQHLKGLDIMQGFSPNIKIVNSCELCDR